MTTPTQVQRPWRATLRTLAQQVVGWVIAAGLVLPLVLAIVQEELGDVIPPEVMAWVAGIVAVAVAISTAAAKIMALPQVDALLSRHRATAGLAADPDAYKAPSGNSASGSALEMKVLTRLDDRLASLEERIERGAARGTRGSGFYDQSVARGKDQDGHDDS